MPSKSHALPVRFATLVLLLGAGLIAHRTMRAHRVTLPRRLLTANVVTIALLAQWILDSSLKLLATMPRLSEKLLFSAPLDTIALTVQQDPAPALLDTSARLALKITLTALAPRVTTVRLSYFNRRAIAPRAQLVATARKVFHSPSFAPPVLLALAALTQPTRLLLSPRPALNALRATTAPTPAPSLP